MPESQIHMTLVEALRDWVAEAYFSGDQTYVYLDSPDANASNRPPKFGGYLPDLYAKLKHTDGIVLGEAKTWSDIDNRHCRDQWTAFMRECSKSEGSVFVIAVPWIMVQQAKTILRFISRDESLGKVNTHIIDNLQG